MFDKEYNNSHHTTVVEAVTQVVEKTISPDKVTDMYADVREEVKSHILRTILSDDNRLYGAAVEIQNDFMRGAKEVYTIFTLNGKEYTNTHILTDGVEITKSDDDIFMMLFQDYVNIISKQLMKECFIKFKRV